MEPQRILGIRELRLMALRAAVTVEPSQDDSIAYAFDGLASAADCVVVSRNHLTLDLSMAESAPPVAFRLRLWVPSKVSLLVNRLFGDADVGDIQGDLSVLAGDFAVRVGNVDRANLTATGAGSIRARSVKRYLEMRTQRSGMIHVEDGAVEQLVAVTERQGSIWYGGRAERGRLVVYEDGPITLHHLRYRPTIFPLGTGRVTVQQIDEITPKS